MLHIVVLDGGQAVLQYLGVQKRVESVSGHTECVHLARNNTLILLVCEVL